MELVAWCGVLQLPSNQRPASRQQPSALEPSTFRQGALLLDPVAQRPSQLQVHPCLAALAHLVGLGRPPALGLLLAPQQLPALHLVLQQPQRQPLALQQLRRLLLARRQRQRLVVQVLLLQLLAHQWRQRLPLGHHLQQRLHSGQQQHQHLGRRQLQHLLLVRRLQLQPLAPAVRPRLLLAPAAPQRLRLLAQAGPSAGPQHPALARVLLLGHLQAQALLLQVARELLGPQATCLQALALGRVWQLVLQQQLLLHSQRLHLQLVDLLRQPKGPLLCQRMLSSGRLPQQLCQVSIPLLMLGNVTAVCCIPH